jgi:hypothetical protein
MVGTNQVVLTFSGDLVTSNVLAFTLKITLTSSGVETNNSMSVTFDTSDANTFATLVTALEALTGISTDTAYASNVLTIVADSGYIIEVSSEAVTLGAGQATITKANSDIRTRAGFAGWINKEQFEDPDSAGSYISRYKANDIAKDIVKGNVIVDSTTGFDAADTLYLIGYGSNRGKIANAAGDNGIAVSDITHRLTASGSSSKGVVAINI